MISPMTQVHEDIEKYDAQLDLANSLMVTSIRASVYREKVARGEVLDPSAAQFLHVLAPQYGTERHLSEMRKRIVETVELRGGAIFFRDKVLNAMHQAHHEVLGECMYQTNEVYNYETEEWDPILDKYCDVWKMGPY